MLISLISIPDASDPINQISCQFVLKLRTEIKQGLGLPYKGIRQKRLQKLAACLNGYAHLPTMPYEMTARSRRQQRMIQEIITPIDRSSLKSTNRRTAAVGTSKYKRKTARGQGQFAAAPPPALSY